MFALLMVQFLMNSNKFYCEPEPEPEPEPDADFVSLLVNIF